MLSVCVCVCVRVCVCVCSWPLPDCPQDLSYFCKSFRSGSLIHQYVRMCVCAYSSVSVSEAQLGAPSFCPFWFPQATQIPLLCQWCTASSSAYSGNNPEGEEMDSSYYLPSVAFCVAVMSLCRLTEEVCLLTHIAASMHCAITKR